MLNLKKMYITYVIVACLPCLLKALKIVIQRRRGSLNSF